MKRSELPFVVCVQNKDYAASLELRKLYQVVADQTAAKLGQVRVIDESGESYLYPGRVLCSGTTSAFRGEGRAAGS